MEMRDPDARNGKMWASWAAAGRNHGKFKVHVCVDWGVVPLSGSWAVIPGIAVCLFVNGALVVTQCPVAPMLRTAGEFGREEA